MRHLLFVALGIVLLMSTTADAENPAVLAAMEKDAIAAGDSETGNFFVVYEFRIQRAECEYRGADGRPATSQLSSSGLTASDERVTIKWQLEPGTSPATMMTGLNFTLTNRSSSTLRVIWDEAAFVDAANKTHRVIHAGTRYIESDRSMPPTTLIRGSSLDDAIFAAEQSHFKTAAGRPIQFSTEHSV